MTRAFLDRRRRRALAAALLALAALATALPRKALFEHRHEGGARPHVHAHAAEGGAIDALLALAHRHEHGDDHDHGHGAHAHHDYHSAHARERAAHLPRPGRSESAPRGAVLDDALVSAQGSWIRAELPGDGHHAHAQSIFQVAVRAALPALAPAIAVALAFAAIAPSAPFAPRARLRARAPPSRLAV